MFSIGNWSLADKNTHWLYYSLPVYWYTCSLKLFWRLQFAVKHLCGQGGLNSHSMDLVVGLRSQLLFPKLRLTTCRTQFADEACDIIQSSRTATQWRQVFPMSRTNVEPLYNSCSGILAQFILPRFDSIVVTVKVWYFDFFLQLKNFFKTLFAMKYFNSLLACFDHVSPSGCWIGELHPSAVNHPSFILTVPSTHCRSKALLWREH